ncbi:hypothetical protein NEPAR04_1476 [Nematocida parisii]|nr:hypothetical protein NEPAR08_1660 [Nematocida parisii]KAI5129637.1 hypothetical protein NEPAR03_1767 [Nematocida parisii]KAI5142230.1 hypothetical protein NEPAR04_1476 [Nematocida parisii]
MLIRKEFIIGAIILCRIYCRVGLNVYVPLHNENIDDKGLKIRLGGSISPMGTLFSEWLKLMRAKRLFSSEVDIEYSLNNFVTPNNSERVLMWFKRKFDNDKAHGIEIIAREGEDPIYIRDYHQTLVYLFPYSHQNFSIYTNRNNSFMRFIQSRHVFEHRINILASLFLLAEGVDVPLKIEGTGPEQVLVLKKISTKENIFSLSMSAMCNIKQPSDIVKPTKVKQEEAVSVINFFIENKTNFDIRNGGRYQEPKAYEDFKTGKFLKNARWLIQHYIFEYLNTKDDIVELAKAVHSMLKESIKQKEKEEYGDNAVEYLGKILDRCFVNSSADIANDCRMSALNVLYGKAFLEDVFPFIFNEDFSRYQRVLSYNRIENSFDSSNLYSNSTEMGLLGLFCYLAYDPEKKEYTTEQMGEVSPDLKKFFSTYNKPFDITKPEIHNEWSKVVADLENENIKYLKENRNKLAPGIINMLYVIAEITGRYSKEKWALKEFSNLLIANGNSHELVEKVEIYAEKLFISLIEKSRQLRKTSLFPNHGIGFSDEDKNSSVVEAPISRYIKVNIHSTLKKERVHKSLDLVGVIFINHSYHEYVIEIRLCHTNDYVSTKYLSYINGSLTNSKRTDTINIISSIEKEKNASLTDYMIKHCLEQTLFNNSIEKNGDPFPENMNIKTENNRLYSIDKFFLYNPIELEGETLKLIYYVRECLLGYPLEETDPWARTISNMIGSLNLHNSDIIQNMFFTPMYTGGLYRNCSKKITISQKILNDQDHLIGEICKYASYLGHSNSVQGNLELIKAYLTAGHYMGKLFSFLLENCTVNEHIRFLKVLSHNGTITDHLTEIARFIDGLDKKNPKYKKVVPSNDVWIIWLRMAFNSDDFVFIIKLIFDKIAINDDFLSRNEGKLKYREKTNEELLDLFERANKQQQEVVKCVKTLIENSPKHSEIFYYTMRMYY